MATTDAATMTVDENGIDANATTTVSWTVDGTYGTFTVTATVTVSDAAAAEGNVITVTPKGSFELSEASGEVSSSVDKDSFDASIAAGTGSLDASCSVSVTDEGRAAT